MRKLIAFFGIVLLFIIVGSCSKQTLISKPYHNITGKYNAYYNANLRLVDSYEMLAKLHRDNYNKPLHMYPYAAVEDASAVKQPLDEAITKCARNIKLHTIGNWTDDSYQLMGEAEFLQKQYERAANTFKFIVDKYHPENVEKELDALRKNKKKKNTTSKKKKTAKKKNTKKKSTKKKTNKNTKDNKDGNNKNPDPNGDPDAEEEEKPINYGLKHRPVRYRSMLWLAKTYIELKQYDEAGYYLRQLENDMQVPYKLRPQVQAVIAYNWVQQKEYVKAIEPLEKAIKDTKQKGIKNRYVYLLAQIYQMQGNNELAMENYKKTLSLKPSYEMEFNAKLNMAKSAAGVTGKKTVDPEIALKRMLRDSKNEEYKDQIYFALAEIKLKSGNTDEGILALQQSLNYSATNAQRTEGCLLLAQLFYKKDDFVQSYAYYDSTLLAMDKKDERYTTTDMYKRSLQGVAMNMAIVLDKDSMRIVGAMDKNKQDAWAVKNMEAEANAAKKAASKTVSDNGVAGKDFGAKKGSSISTQDENGLSIKGGSGTNAATGTITVNADAIQKSKFALYNPTLQKKGEKDFQKRWNERPWVDNWRRADRSDEGPDTDGVTAVTVAPKTKSEIDAYLRKRGVPANEEEKKALEDKLGEAMFRAAEHYREDLGRTDKAMELVQRLVSTYPQNAYAVEALFLAYNIYSEENNASKVSYYKNEILTKHPDSKIAKLLSDPNFANSEAIKYQKINKYYDDTYAMIRNGKAEQALDKLHAVPTEFGQNYEMKARFALLEAMCIGGMKGEQDYVKALKVIVTSFPNTNEEKQAKAMIAVLDGQGNVSSGIKNTNTDVKNDGELYKLDMKNKHLVMVVFEDKDAAVNQHRVPITEFNNKYYLSSRLATSSILVDGNVPSLTIRAFANGELAMQYVVDARSNAEFMPGVQGYQVYAISQANYNVALSSQKFKDYIEFFNNNYK